MTAQPARGEPLAGLEAVLARWFEHELTHDRFMHCDDDDPAALLAPVVRAHLAATLAEAREDVARAIYDVTPSPGTPPPWDEQPTDVTDAWCDLADAALSVIAARLGIEGGL